MVNENNNINQYVNKKPFEIVQEVNNEVPSFEEFMKTYEVDEKAIDSYNGEFDGYGDIRIVKCYGPGFWDDIKGFVKPVASVALVAASVFPPTAAVAAPITLGIAGTGAAVAGVGHVTDSEGWKETGKDIMEIALNADTGQDAIKYDKANSKFASRR